MKCVKSKNFKDEYCITVVKIGEIKPVAGSDYLAVTMVNGEPIVIRKDEVVEGDTMLYAANESQLDSEFLKHNNLFEDATLNEDQTKRGFFNKHGRVRAIKLRGQISRGFLFKAKDLEFYSSDGLELPAISESFDAIGERIIIKPYIPIKQQAKEHSQRNLKKRNRGIRKLQRIVDGEFSFHYDTQLLAKNIHKIRPEDYVTISVKCHGTSAIFANVLTRNPIPVPSYKRWWNRMIDKFWFPEWLRFKDWELSYGNVYSSRSVIKNKDLNPGVTDGFYNADVWGYWNELLKPYIPKGWTIYGEIVGYVPGSQKMIQKGYDYGCAEGESKFIPYRITRHIDNYVQEMDAVPVGHWAMDLIKENPEFKGKIMPLPILYHGEFNDLYNAELVVEMGTEKWYEVILQSLRDDRVRFGMEKNEPLCKNKVPREGICLRVDQDPIAECFKLKTDKFLGKEQKEIDAGNVDMEMTS